MIYCASYTHSTFQQIGNNLDIGHDEVFTITLYAKAHNQPQISSYARTYLSVKCSKDAHHLVKAALTSKGSRHARLEGSPRRPAYHARFRFLNPQIRRCSKSQAHIRYNDEHIVVDHGSISYSSSALITACTEESNSNFLIYRSPYAIFLQNMI